MAAAAAPAADPWEPEILLLQSATSTNAFHLQMQAYSISVRMRRQGRNGQLFTAEVLRHLLDSARTRVAFPVQPSVAGAVRELQIIRPAGPAAEELPATLPHKWFYYELPVPWVSEDDGGLDVFPLATAKVQTPEGDTQYLFSMTAFFHPPPKRDPPAVFFGDSNKNAKLWELAGYMGVETSEYYPNKASLSRKKPPVPMPSDRFVGSRLMGTPKLLVLTIDHFLRVPGTRGPLQQTCLDLLCSIVKVCSFPDGKFCGMAVHEGKKVDAEEVKARFSAAGRA